MIHASPSPRLVAEVRELLRRAILTLAAVPDPDLRHRLGPRSSWPDYVRHARDAYGVDPPKRRIFTANEQDLTRFLEVLSWLDWYARRGSQSAWDVRLFKAWTFGAPIWQLQERCTTNRRQTASAATVYNRLKRPCIRIADKFGNRVRILVVDGLVELHEKGAFQPDGRNSVSSTLEALPTSLKAVPYQGDKPVPDAQRKPQEVAEAQRLLVRRLERNRSRAARRRQQAKG